MQLRGHHDVVLDSLDQRRHQPSCLADPIGERCAIELDAFARIDAGLPIERKMIAVPTRTCARSPALGWQ